MGSGTFGIVYRVCLAEEPGAGEYALKLARAPADPRFEREAELLGRLRHPHVPGLRDHGIWQGDRASWYPYLVMQWVEGLPLYRWSKLRGLTSRQALLLLAQVARALEATHRHGVHWDVKGDNILVTSEGNAVLVDFGCCWYPGARELTEGLLPPGTRHYRSAQALRHEREGRPVRYVGTPADDVYALGVTAYYLVTRTYPPPGTDAEGGPSPRLLPPSELATVAPELEALILRMLREEPQERGAAGELAEALEQAAKSAGPEADKRVEPTRSMQLTERAARPGPPRWYLVRKALARHSMLLAGGGALAAGVLAAVLLPPLPGLEHEEHAEEEDLGDAGVDERTVGLADAGVEEVLASAVRTPRLSVLATPLPKKPLPGQQRPPCEPERQRAINGLCWWTHPWKPPCGPSAYEYEERCYTAVILIGRPPTSEEP
jgi:hypothetical protein